MLFRTMMETLKNVAGSPCPFAVSASRDFVEIEQASVINASGLRLKERVAI